MRRSRFRASMLAIGLSVGVVAVSMSSAADATAASGVRVVHYDSNSMAEYARKWSNPYGLGEMAVSDTRAVSNGVFSLSATPFKTAYDYSVFDHIKYLGVSNRTFAVPKNGTLAFSVDIKAATPGAVSGHVVHGQYGPPGSYDPSRTDTYVQPTLEGQQAGVVMNMIDFCTGQLFDWFVSSHYVFPLIERLPTSVTGNINNPNCPGATNVGLDKAYTQIIQQIPVTPGRAHTVTTAYTRLGHNSNVTYLLDGVPVATVDNVGVPLDRQGHPYSGIYPSLGAGEPLADQINSFSIGHGLFSLLDAFPFQYGCTPPTASGPGSCDPATAQYSVSIPLAQRAFGQGAVGSFSHFTAVTVGL
jgi:hypothetical protein